MPAMQPSWWPYGCVRWSLVALLQSSLPVTWFARSLVLGWLTGDNCVLLGYLCET